MVEDLPVGKGAGDNPFGAEHEQPPTQAAAGADDDKPLEDRIVSKAWASRKSAFEELNGIINKFDKGTSNQVMNQHASKWAKYLMEPNPGAMEKVLECFQSFIDKSDPAILVSIQNGIYLPVLDKCLGAAKPNLKAKAMECMLLFFEVSEHFDAETLDAFQAHLKSPKPKIAATAMQLLAACMTAFGIKKFSPARFTPQIVAAANSSAPATRNEAMNCYKAIFRWVGEAGVQPFIDPLKEAQKVQLKKDFETITAEKKEFKRKTRTEQEAAKASAIDDAIAEEEKKDEVIDVFDISAPQEILGQFGADWCTNTLAFKKWGEKKEAMEQVITAADVPKLATGDYSALFEVLKKLAADAHVAVSQYAIKAIGCLAKGLRDAFHDNAILAVPVIMAKFKEKRMTEDILGSLEKCLMCCTLAEILESLNVIKKEKMPFVKQNIAIFMERAIRETYIDTLEEIVDQLAPLAVAISGESDAKARDQGLIVLGVLAARVPNQMEKHVNPLNDAKKAKVNAAKETVKISKYDKSEKKAAAAAAAAKKKAAAAPAKKAAPAPAKKKAAVMTFDNDDEQLANDGVLSEVVPAKPRGPPPNIGKKPVKKAAPASEELAQPDPPKRGPPARLAGKAAAAAPSGPIKTLKADDIQEEDIGSGMGKDQAIERVQGFYDAGIVAKFEEAKWQDKVEGYNQLKEAIASLQPDKLMVEATCKFIKARMKDWKESNINLMKEAINTFTCMTQHCEDVPKRAVAVYSPFLCDKIGDIKMSTAIKELLLNLSEFATAKFVSVQVVKKGLGAKAPNNIKESCNFLAMQIEEFGAGRVSIKECIDFAVHCANNANKAVRDAALALTVVLFKHLGEKINKFLEGVKPNTMALIQAEFEKATPYAKGEFECKRQVKGEAAEVEQAAGGGGGGAEPDALAALEDAMPRADISKQLTAKVIKMFEESDWKLKVKGCETVQGILRDAGMRIQPDGINDLMDQIKNNFKASNKAVLKQCILLMGVMAEAVGQPILQYNKKCFKPLVGMLSDKAALMRADVISSANKWSEAIGAEYVIQNMCTFLSDGNPEMRNESLKWICANKDAIAKCELQPMVKPIIMCLTDRAGPIRVMADEVIVAMMAKIGFQPFQEGIKDLKPAVQQTVRPLLEKAKQKAIAANPDAASMNAGDDDAPASAAAPKKTAIKGGATARKSVVTASKPTLKEQPSPTKAAAAPQRKTGLTRATVTAPKAAPMEAQAEEFNINPGNKERRAANDQTQKWVWDDIKPQHATACKNHSEQIFGAEVSKLMWGTDFKKHLQVIEKMLTLIDSSPESLMECIDVIFKWTAIKLAESSNTAFQSGVYDFYRKVFEFLIASDYLFWDHEAIVVIPLLCDKAGNNNAVLKAKVKALIKMVFDMHDHKKTVLMMIKYGATNKNLKSAGESLEEIATFLKTQQSVPFGEQQIKVIAKLVDSKDPIVRENAIQVLSEIYKVLDEDIWRVVGNVPLKVKGLLTTRFKKVKGLGSSSSNLGATAPSRPSGARPAASPKSSKSGADTLTKSFNPGLKTQTPRNTGLKFNNTTQDSEQSQKQPLTRSFRPGTSSQNNLTKSFGSKSIGGGFGSQRPQTAVNQEGFRRDLDEQISRQTMPPPSQNNQFAQEQISDDNIRNTDVLNFHPPANEMRFMDDDEDLRQQIQEMEGPKKETLDPETQRQVDDIMKHISNLKYSSDLNKRVESLIALNDIIQAVQKREKAIQHTANDLISAFTHVLIDIFERPRQETPLRFAKYFVTIVNKTCQCSTIMSVVREQELYDLGEQLLTRLLIENLDKLGDEKEGEFILKNLNGSMLRCLENCNKTSIFCVLFNLMRRYKDTSVQVKLPGLIIKCLLKLSKILEKVINELEIDRVLIVIHLYLISIDHERKTSNDEMGIRIVKTLVHEMVKIKAHSILESYKVVENHEVEDKHLYRWIKIILNTFDPQTAPSQAGNNSVNQSTDSINGDAINQIITELKSTDQFQTAIPKLHTFLTRNPHLSLDYYIKDLSQYFQDMIKQNLETYRNQLSDSGSTPNGKVNISQPPANPQDRPSFAQKSQSSLSLSSQNSETKRFGFRASVQPSSGGFNEAASKASALGGTSSQQRLSKPAAGTGADSTTSTDRINSYQSKLSSMREKFQQRKTLTGNEPPAKSVSLAASSGGAAAQKTLGASFSAMNSSLQQRWKAVQTKEKTGTGTARESAQGSQFANTMVAGAPATSNRFSTEVAPNTQGLTSQNQMGASQGANGAATGEGGASNQELNKRLVELRSKLATLRK